MYEHTPKSQISPGRTFPTSENERQNFGVLTAYDGGGGGQRAHPHNH
jgi:hypothetical protein